MQVCHASYLSAWQWDAKEAINQSLGRAVFYTPFSIRHFSSATRTEWRPLPAILYAVAKNKVRDRQIAWISNFEIEVIVKNERDLMAESLDC